MDLYAAYVQLLLILFPIPLFLWIERHARPNQDER